MTTPIAIPQDPEKIRQASQKVWPHIDDETPTSLVQHIANLHTFLAHYQALLNASPDPEPFDLERAKAGEAVQTRDGRKVRLLCFDRKSADDSFPLAGLVEDPKTEWPVTWTKEGNFFAQPANDDRDLFMAPRPVEHRIIWLNVYPDYSVSPFRVHTDREFADRCADRDRIACIPVAVPEGGKG